MDYEKKYNEALERAKAGKPIDEVFTELKESEDERIRKMLIERVRNAEELNEELRERIIAYLEKQKKKKPLCIHSAGSGAMGTTHPSFKLDVKPAERSNIDELKLQTIEAVIARQKGSAAFGGFLPAELIDYIKSLRPQPKVEWSEEDELKLSLCIDALDVGQTKRHIYEQGITPDELNAWLKSFRNRPTKSDTWKPSKEQMDWLESAVRLSTDLPHIHGIIISLYEQLKRL